MVLWNSSMLYTLSNKFLILLSMPKNVYSELGPMTSQSDVLVKFPPASRFYYPNRHYYLNVELRYSINKDQMTDSHYSISNKTEKKIIQRFQATLCCYQVKAVIYPSILILHHYIITNYQQSGIKHQPSGINHQ